jgi:L-iditol 2-dehydrogenase
MQVAMWYNNRDIRIEELPQPDPGPGEMLIKVEACGICGSDIVEWYRLPRAPLVQGHEVAGEVVSVGADVSQFQCGDRVAIAPKMSCGKCSYCRNGHDPQCTEIKERLPGGFAEYVLVPEIFVQKGAFRLPESLSYEESTLMEPLACVVRAQRLAGIKEGQTVFIAGCGTSGLLHVKLARSKNANVVTTDISPAKLQVAKSNGVAAALDAGKESAAAYFEHAGKKADVIMVCTSAMSAIEQAWQCLDKGGTIVFYTVPGPDKKITVPLNDFWTRGIKLLTSYYCGPTDLAEALELLATGTIKVDDMITHRLPLAETDKGFSLVLAGQEAIKVIISP